MLKIVQRLLDSDEPCVRFKVRTNVLSEDVASPAMKKLRREIKASPRVQALFAESGMHGRLPHHPYAKWYGAHWIMATLADIGYPPGDRRLLPWREQVYEWLLTREGRLRKCPCINGRVRRHASMEGNAVYYLLKLGLADERIEQLVQGLIECQWPDGGWNCDPKPQAHNSSFHESLTPLRGLTLYARLTGDAQARVAARRAAEIFLKRRMFQQQSDGHVIKEDFVRLHYPCYWHYDVLFGLKVMAEAGFIGDPRCSDALDLVETKRLPDGGWPAEKKHYAGLSRKLKSQRELVSWGPVGKRMNEFVTADALYVLQAARRLHR
ncbi:MAG: hypothetical protein HY000_14345 [Planctomycetes bacterium]|nr:hypothetical protein [Planctomycetota bacterium]